MTVKENKGIFLRWIEDINRQDISRMDEVFAPDFTWGAIRNREQFREGYLNFLKSFPDYHCEPEEIVAEDDKVVLLATITAAFADEYMGIPPTNEKVRWKEVSLDRFVDGKIVERICLLADEAARLQQMGGIPGNEGQARPKQ